MKCWNCGEEYEGNFCPSCGKRDKDKIERKTCPKCKTVVSGSAKFCNNCGYTFKETNQGTGQFFSKIKSFMKSAKAWCKKHTRLLIGMGIVLTLITIIIIAVAVSNNIFRAGKVDAISIGDTKAQVQKVLGKPDDDNYGIWTYYDKEYKKLDEQSEKYGKAVFEAETEKEAQKALEKVAEIDKKMESGIFKRITVSFGSGDTVEEIMLNKQYKIEGAIKKTPKKIKFNDINAIEKVGCLGAVAKVYYTDGSYRSKYYSFSKITYNGEEISNSQMTNIGNYQVTISDSWGEYSTKLEVKKFITLESLNFTTELDGIKYRGTKQMPYLICVGATNENITTAMLPAGCVVIENEAFKNCGNLISITIPDSVTSIYGSAFEDCSSLTSVTIGNSVTSIGSYAFEGCSSLTSVTIGNSVTSIGERAFIGCSSLTSVTIPDSVTSIGSFAFNNCSSLTSVTIGNSVTSIGSFAFYNCSSLTSVTIGNSVTSIGNDAFYICSSLTKVNYTGTIDQWVQIDFDNSSSNPVYCAGNLYIDNQLITTANITTATRINGSAFYNCSSLTSVTIGNSVTSIGNFAFDGCSSLTKVNYTGTIDRWVQINFYNVDYHISNPLSYAGNLYINNQLITTANITTATKINNYAFRGCSSLTSVTIGNSVTSIGYEAFYNCSSLTSVTIPNSVTSIRDYAFSRCSNLTTINYAGTEEQWNAISKGDDWDLFTGNYTIVYNYVEE